MSMAIASNIDDGLETVRRYVDDLREGRGTGNGRLREPQTITILGGRGQGKSTLLAAIPESVTSDDTLTLPAADPEFFYPGDDLVTWLLAGLESKLPKEVLASVAFGEDSLGKALQEFRRQYVTAIGNLPELLVRRGSAPAEYARDASRLSTIGMRLITQWNELLDVIAEILRQPRLMVLLPVDDVDLHPSRLSPLLAQLHLLGTSRRFVAIFAVDEATLLHSLTVGDDDEFSHWRRAAEIGSSSTGILSEVASRKYTKFFPRQHRLRLAEVPPSDRLGYRPIGSSDSIGDLLARFPLRWGEPESCLRDLFVVQDVDGSVVGTSDYVNSISGNRRDLQQLHAALASAHRNGMSVRAAISVILDHGLEVVRPSIPPELWDSVVVEPLVGSDVPEARFKFDKIQFGTTLGVGSVVRRYENRGSGDLIALPITARRMSNLYASLRGNRPGLAAAHREEPPVENPSLPQMYMALLMLAWECTFCVIQDGDKILERASLQGRISLPGGTNWTGTFYVGTEARRGRYLTTPDWEEHSDYFSYMRTWNMFVGLSSQLPAVIADNLADCFILAHLETVLSVAAARRTPTWMTELSVEDLVGILDDENWETFYAARIRTIQSLIRELKITEQSGELDWTRDRDNLDWVSTGLPRAMSRNIASGKLSDDLFAIWLASDVTLDERELLANELSQEISGYIATDQAEADIKLLKLIDEARAEVLWQVRENMGELADGERRDTLRKLQGRFGDQPAFQRLEDDGAVPEVLAALRLLGVDPSELPNLVDLFPPARDLPDTSESMTND